MPRRKATPQPSPPGVDVVLPQKRGRSSLSDLILRAVCLSTSRKGASLALIKKTLAAEGYDVARNGTRLKTTLGGLVSKGLLQRVTGSGVAGSFRISRAGKERLEGAGRRGRAGGAARKRPAAKTKRPRRRVKATAQRMRRPGKRRGRAAAVAAEEPAEAGEAEVEVAACAAAGGGDA